MNRWAVILGCVLCLMGAGCAADDSGGSGGAAGSGAGAGAANGGTSSGGRGGMSAGSSGAGSGGRAGNAGTGSTAGTGGTSAGTGSSGTGGASGAGTAGAGGSGGSACGSRGLPECEDGSFCDFPPEIDCGRADGPGMCRGLTDLACQEIYAPVCGCDGMTYSSSCHAYSAGMSVDYEGECGEELPTGGHTCVPPAGVACLIAPPECPEGEVPAYEVSECGGECVPIEQCDCSGPEDCPLEEMYTCHLSAAHCGPYVN
jgi:hypothetical protein